MEEGDGERKNDPAESAGSFLFCFMSPLSVFFHRSTLPSFSLSPSLFPDAGQTKHFGGDSAVLQMGSKTNCVCMNFSSILCVVYCVFVMLLQTVSKVVQVHFTPGIGSGIKA